MLFNELAIIISVASVLGIIAIWIRQPSILGYIIAGFALAAFGHINAGSAEFFGSLGSLGVALLLFLVGLEMDFDKIKSLGRHIIIIGAMQTVAAVGIGFGAMQLMNFSITASIYLALAFSFSSTIIAIKLLSEKRDLSSLYGRIVIGIMLLEDFIAILMLIFLEGISNGGAAGSVGLDFAFTILKGIGLLILTLVISRIMPKVLEFIGTKGESLFLFSIAWGIGIAALVATKQVGLGIEAGGFLAGLAFARSAEHYEISGKIRWLRDFFIVIFFVLLGAKMATGGDLSSVLWQAVIVSLIVLIVNPVITIISMGALGYSGRTAFLTGLTTAQISEFSLVVAARGGELGHLSQNQVNLVTLVGIITIIVSSYLVVNGEIIYRRLKKLINFFAPDKEEKAGLSDGKSLRNHVILVGAHRLGVGIMSALIERNQKFVVIDFDPHITKELSDKGIPVIHGDGSDQEVQEEAGIDKARVIISTVPSLEDNMALIKEARRANKKIKTVVTADSEREGEELYAARADYVIMPHFIGGEHLGDVIRGRSWAKELEGMKTRDLKSIHNR
ncbi:MAG: cation:proton antiporter [Candidatus Colwellbacteria bacterium]|nr:cation:proton antiporter [Candidatus Colwellbacteria bacterium]